MRFWLPPFDWACLAGQPQNGRLGYIGTILTRDRVGQPSRDNSFRGGTDQTSNLEERGAGGIWKPASSLKACD